MSASGNGTPDLQGLLGAATTGGLPDAAPGPTAPPAETAAGVSAVELKSWYVQKFNDEVAVSQDLMNSIRVLTSAAPNETVKSTLDNTIKVLQGREADLKQSVAELETVAEQAAVPFTEEAPAVTGIAREHIYTLQDYILFIFVLTYTVFALILLVLVGKRTGWSKSALGKMLGGLAVFTGLGYVVIQRYA
jgi:hypothetical protein